MSGQVTGWLIRHPDAPISTDRALWDVLTVMADSADTAGLCRRLSTRAIAELARMSLTHTRRKLADAVAAGWLELVDPGSNRYAAVYRFAKFSTGKVVEMATMARSAPNPPSNGAQRAKVVAEKAQNGSLRLITVSPQRAVDNSPPAPACQCDGTGWVEVGTSRAVVRCGCR